MTRSKPQCSIGVWIFGHAFAVTFFLMHLGETLKLCTQRFAELRLRFRPRTLAAVCPIDVVGYREDMAIVL